ncbi:hypothetical protein [Streptomyces sp. NPDC017529]|uniref:hypothetical protein n=1 Tax=Streptomyces sp. NPDC017529 TaxID=3365000 RepID=UPI0037BB16BE
MKEKGIHKGNWSVFEHLAAMCITPSLLQDAAECLTTATVPAWYRNRRPDAEWLTSRSKAADALAGNPLCPVDALAALAPLLTPVTAERFTEHPDARVREAAVHTVTTEVERVATPAPAPVARKQPVRPAVPSDDVLADSSDPRAVLAGFLPLKGLADYKREVARAILASRFTDAGLLRELPAPLTLTSAHHAPAVAGLLQSELGDDAKAWEAFETAVARLSANTTKTLAKLLADVRSSSSSG